MPGSWGFNYVLYAMASSGMFAMAVMRPRQVTFAAYPRILRILHFAQVS